MLSLINLVRNITNSVQERNQKDPEVKTADTSIFDKLNERLNNEEGSDNADSHVDMFERMRNHIDEVKYENECDEECETAEPSVFDNLQREIEMLKKKVEAQEVNDAIGQQSDSWVAPTPSRTGSVIDRSGPMQAMTNSKGGSLGMSKNPQIGGETHVERIPDHTVVKVISYSDNVINLDNQDTRFAYIEYNGQRGWIPELYLNFN